MTNKQKLNRIKKLEFIISDIKLLAISIIKDTFDDNIVNVIDMRITDDYVDVTYGSNYYGEWSFDEVRVPIKWFKEGYDYCAEYNASIREQAKEWAKAQKKAQKEERKKKAAAKKKAKAAKAKREYNKYLRLKKKYENGESK